MTAADIRRHALDSLHRCVNELDWLEINTGRDMQPLIFDLRALSRLIEQLPDEQVLLLGAR